MSESTPEQVTAPETPVQHRHEYQPTDEHGRALGGKQVILYTTPDELATKLTEQNVLLIRKLREEGRKRRLGIEDEAAPDTMERMQNPIEFKERNLSTDERFALTQQLNDPNTFASARDLLIESAIGVPPAQLREFLQNQQTFEIQQRAAENYLQFIYSEDARKNYYDCNDNRATLTDWMFKQGLAPTVANFHEASAKLREAGLLLGAPEQQPRATTTAAPAVENVATEAQSPLPAVEQPRIGSDQQPQPKRQVHIPSGLNENNSSASGTSATTASGATRADGTLLTLRDINRMPSDEIKRRMKDPAFNALVDKLETEQKQKAASLGLQRFA
jgi:hypothetical protein